MLYHNLNSNVTESSDVQKRLVVVATQRRTVLSAIKISLMTLKTVMEIFRAIVRGGRSRWNEACLCEFISKARLVIRSRYALELIYSVLRCCLWSIFASKRNKLICSRWMVWNAYNFLGHLYTQQHNGKKKSEVQNHVCTQVWETYRCQCCREIILFQHVGSSCETSTMRFTTPEKSRWGTGCWIESFICGGQQKYAYIGKLNVFSFYKLIKGCLNNVFLFLKQQCSLAIKWSMDALVSQMTMSS